MYINNVVRSTFSAIQNIENKGDNFKISLNSVILVCYNTIVSFIKPILNKNINYLGLNKNISNIENKINRRKSKIILLKNNNELNRIEVNDFVDEHLSEAKRKVKSDKIKESVISNIISSLEEISTLDKEIIINFNNELHFHSKWILFSGNTISLKEIKNEFLESIIDTILNSDYRIKSKFGNIDSYKYFLRDDINNAVESILYKN